MRDKPDEALVEMAQSGDREAANILVQRYEKFVRYLCRPYFAKDCTKDDIIQEGLIGLLKAIRMYKADKSVFLNYARLSVVGQLNSMVTRIHRDKAYINQISGSLDVQLFDDNPDRTLAGAIRATDKSPEEIIIEQEGTELFYARIREYLSPIEQAVIIGYIEDKTYVEIAEQIGRGTKTVDNALQRAKQKLRKAYQLAG